LRKVAKRLLFSVLPEWTLGLFGERGTKGNEGAANQNMANAQEFYNSDVLAQDLPSLPELPSDFANDLLPAPEVVSAVVASENGGEANAANNAANKIVKLASKRAVSARQSR
jgi:hypothetical protein